MSDEKSCLFLDGSVPSRNLFLNNLKAAGEALCRGYEGVESAYNRRSPQELKALLEGDELLPAQGWGWEKTLARAEELLIQNSLKVCSHDYMAHLHGPPLMDSVAAELLLAGTNQSMDSWDQAPMATEMELRMARQLCGLIGFPDGADGIFTAGGSQSNLMGLLIGRDWFLEKRFGLDVRREGLSAEVLKVRIYTSEVSHFSMEKSAHLLGLGYRAVRAVPVDPRQKMSMPALEEMIREDLEAGFIPMMVAATAGTTDFGSIDPLKEIRRICDDHGLWMHIDAAYGGGLILSEKFRGRIAGLETTDSLTVDFHKMFLQPISCGGFFLKNGGEFSRLTLHADYLNREEDEEEGYENLVGKSLATTRRFDALKIWMSFKSLGAGEWARMMDRTVDNARRIYERLLDDPRFSVITKPEISSVVFRYIGGTGEEDVRDEINASVRRELIHRFGTIIGQTKAGGRTHLKMTLLNPLVEPEKIFDLLERIAEMGEERRGEL